MEIRLISIIMPAYNASNFIGEAIHSVLQQTWQNWELLIVNDGSTDNTHEVVERLRDTRIKYFVQQNKGVSAARNLALSVMKGDYFCFLDADDFLPPDSLSSRLLIFERCKGVAFVDGVVEKRSSDMSTLVYKYTPAYRGWARGVLIQLSSSCFVGLSWMIRRNKSYRYCMEEGVTHGEDLLFLIRISDQGLFDYTKECVLWYRQTDGSAMTNLQGLQKGYSQIYLEIKKNQWANKKQLFLLKLKIAKIMVCSWVKKGKPLKSILAFVDIIIK